MRSLSKAAAGTFRRLDDIETGVKTLLSELDRLDTRLRRAFAAVCIDSCVAHFRTERRRMLEGEKRAETAAGLAKLPALAIHGLLSLASRDRPDWKSVVDSVFQEEPFQDVRVMVSNDGIALINLSGIARERGITVDGVVAHVEERGYEMFSWPAFEARAQNLRMAALRGEAVHLGLEEAGSADIEALATGVGPGSAVLS